MSNKIDGDIVFDKVLRKKIADPTTPEEDRELAKALLSYSPYYEEYKEETEETEQTSSKKRQKQKK